MFQTIDHTPRLNVFTLHHAGAFTPGVVTLWEYPGISHQAARARGDFGKFHIAINDGPEVTIAIERVDGTYGSSYPLFACPCGARRRYYVKDGVVACRACLQLHYACRHEYQHSPHVRKLQRVSRLRASLLTSRRPMRSRKRRAILARIEAIEVQAAEAMAEVIERLAEGRYVRRH